jgi:hypothetical protein
LPFAFVVFLLGWQAAAERIKAKGKLQKANGKNGHPPCLTVSERD